MLVEEPDMLDIRRSEWDASSVDCILLSDEFEVNEAEGWRVGLASVVGLDLFAQLKPLDPPPGPRSKSLLFFVKFCFFSNLKFQS